MCIKDEMHVAEFEDMKSGITFTCCFECLKDLTDFIRLYPRPLDTIFIQPVYSFGMDPIYKERSEKFD